MIKIKLHENLTFIVRPHTVCPRGNIFSAAQLSVAYNGVTVCSHETDHHQVKQNPQHSSVQVEGLLQNLSWHLCHGFHPFPYNLSEYRWPEVSSKCPLKSQRHLLVANPDSLLKSSKISTKKSLKSMSLQFLYANKQAINKFF